MSWGTDEIAAHEILRDVAEVDRVRAAVMVVALAWFLDGGEPEVVAASAGVPRAALDDAIRWRLRGGLR